MLHITLESFDNEEDFVMAINEITNINDSFKTNVNEITVEIINENEDSIIKKGVWVMYEFKNFDYLTDEEIDLIIEVKAPAYEPKRYLPAYKYQVRLHNDDVSIGKIDLRIGYNKNTYYGGNIGYEIEELYRGNHYAAKACRLIKQIALAHEMDRIIITCNPYNIASRKTCEYVGARLVGIAQLPPDNEMYQLGDRQKCRYEWVCSF